MTGPPDALVHATCVALGGRAVLLAGPSGAGKSDLALRLIDRGASLVSDDYTELRCADGLLLARAPAAIAGKMEIRGVGLIALERTADLPVCLYADLGAPPERLPEAAAIVLVSLEIPRISLAALEPSAPLKLEYALVHFGLAL